MTCRQERTQSSRLADSPDGQRKRQQFKHYSAALRRAERERQRAVKRLPLRGAGHVQAHAESVVNHLVASAVQAVGKSPRIW